MHLHHQKKGNGHFDVGLWELLLKDTLMGNHKNFPEILLSRKGLYWILDGIPPFVLDHDVSDNYLVSGTSVVYHTSCVVFTIVHPSSAVGRQQQNHRPLKEDRRTPAGNIK